MTTHNPHNTFIKAPISAFKTLHHKDNDYAKFCCIGLEHDINIKIQQRCDELHMSIADNMIQHAHNQSDIKLSNIESAFSSSFK